MAITHKQGTNILVGHNSQKLLEEASKILGTKSLVTNHQTKSQSES